jgi:hypothetical protein
LGSLVVLAGLVGLPTGSPTGFAISLGALLLVNLIAGE